MLVLTRKTGETINIDGDITIQIVRVQGRQVRVGISAPKEKKVERGELKLASPHLKPALLSKTEPAVKSL